MFVFLGRTCSVQRQCLCYRPQFLMNRDGFCFGSLLNNTDTVWWVQSIFKQLPPEILLYILLFLIIKLMNWAILTFG